MTRMSGVQDRPTGIESRARAMPGEIEVDESAGAFPNLMKRLSVPKEGMANSGALPTIREAAPKTPDMLALRSFPTPLALVGEGEVAKATDASLPGVLGKDVSVPLPDVRDGDGASLVAEGEAAPELDDAALSIAALDATQVDMDRTTGEPSAEPASPTQRPRVAVTGDGAEMAGPLAASAILADAAASGRPALQQKHESGLAERARMGQRSAGPIGADLALTRTDGVAATQWGQTAVSPEAVEAAGDAQAKDVSASLPTGEIKVTVLRVETHLAPPGQGQPALQIAERITAELAAADTEAPAGINPKPTHTAGKADTIVKVLHIQLQPVELGPVTVRMSLRQDALELRIETSRQATAHVLQHDRHALAKALHAAGYSIDGLSVQVVEPDRSLAGQSGFQATQSSFASSTPAHSGGSQHQNGTSGGHRHAQSEAARSAAASGAAETQAQRTGGGGVYL